MTHLQRQAEIAAILRMAKIASATAHDRALWIDPLKEAQRRINALLAAIDNKPTNKD